jgi:hypothetical protein
MFTWIAGYVGRWAQVVPDTVRDLVHWGLHALAGVVYAVFGNVGRAWKAVVTAAQWLWRTAGRYVAAVETALRYVIKVYVPAVWHQAEAWWKDALSYADGLYRLALRGIADLRAWAETGLAAVRSWAVTNIWAPLTAGLAQLRSDLLHWGYTAWYYVTHPAALAPLLIDAMVAAAIAAFDRIAPVAGEFALRLVARQPGRWLALLERIVSAVL